MEGVRKREIEREGVEEGGRKREGEQEGGKEGEREEGGNEGGTERVKDGGTRTPTVDRTYP